MKNPESKSIWHPEHELSQYVTTIRVNGTLFKKINGNILADWDSQDREKGLGYPILYGSDPANFVQDPYEEPKKRGRKRFK